MAAYNPNIGTVSEYNFKKCIYKNLCLLIFIRFAPSGSSVLCPGEGSLQTCTRGADEAGRRGEGYTFLKSSHLHELSLLRAAGELQPLPKGVLYCSDIKSRQQCSQGEHLRNNW